MKPVWNTEKQIYYNYDNYFFLFCLKKEMCIDLKKGTIIKGEKLCMVIHDQHWKGYLSFCNVCTFSFFFFTYSPIHEIKTDIYIYQTDRILSLSANLFLLLVCRSALKQSHKKNGRKKDIHVVWVCAQFLKFN